MIARLMSLSVLTFCCAGCLTAQYDTGKPLKDRIVVDAARASITEPSDGADARPRTYEGSGKQLATELSESLKRRGLTVGVGYVAAPPSSFINGRYVPAGRFVRVKPTIELWSDRVTEWSGRSDQLKIRMVVVDQATGATLDDRVITATSKW